MAVTFMIWLILLILHIWTTWCSLMHL